MSEPTKESLVQRTSKDVALQIRSGGFTGECEFHFSKTLLEATRLLDAHVAELTAERDELVKIVTMTNDDRMVAALEENARLRAAADAMAEAADQALIGLRMEHGAPCVSVNFGALEEAVDAFTRLSPSPPNGERIAPQSVKPGVPG